MIVVAVGGGCVGCKERSTKIVSNFSVLEAATRLWFIYCINKSERKSVERGIEMSGGRVWKISRYI